MKKSLSVILALLMVLSVIPFAGVSSFAAASGDFSYKILGDGTAEITNYKGSDTNLTIPSEIDVYTVTSIGTYAFWNCASLENVTISDSIKNIGDYAFEDCTSLKRITIGNNVRSIGDAAFYNCTSLESVTIPSGVTSIGNNTFYSCDSLESITIPDSVAYIGSGAFGNTAYYNTKSNWDNDVLYICNHLIQAKEDAKLGNYAVRQGTKTIANWAFYYCTGLTNITVPNSVTSIGNYAFYNCINLESATIGECVTNWGIDAFYACYKLITIYGYTGSYAEEFANENDYTFISMGIAQPSFRYTIKGDGTAEIIAYFGGVSDLEIPSDIDGYAVTSIGPYVFVGRNTLENVIIPDSVTSIGYWAFAECTSLTSVTIGNNVTDIETEAFCHCTSLENITIPDSVTNIGSGVFYNTAYYNAELNWNNGVLYIDNHLIVAKNDKLSSNYIIHKGTKTIACGAFEECESLESITISDSVTSIGNGAFFYCISLESITIPDSVTSIGDYAFCACIKLETITIPDSVTYIGDCAFEACGNLRVIYGYSGSYAESYANENGYSFIPIQDFEDVDSGISMIVMWADTLPENTIFNVETIDVTDDSVIYDITLNADGEEIQPNGTVTVKIPVPDGMDDSSVKVYHEEKNGLYTDMKAVYKNGYMVFTTDHFSRYILTTQTLGVKLGDVNDDGYIDAADAVMIQRYDAGLITLTAEQLAAADVNGDGIVDASDAVKILRYDAGAIKELNINFKNNVLNDYRWKKCVCRCVND